MTRDRAWGATCSLLVVTLAGPGLIAHSGCGGEQPERQTACLNKHLRDESRRTFRARWIPP